MPVIQAAQKLSERLRRLHRQLKRAQTRLMIENLPVDHNLIRLRFTYQRRRPC